MSDETFIIRLRPLRHKTPVEIRLRQALKLLLRAFAFEAVAVRPEGENVTAPSTNSTNNPIQAKTSR